MPRKKNKNLLHSTDKVLVRSKTYGNHLRAPRGSKTEIRLNDVLDTNCKKAPDVSGTGKPVIRYLKMREPGFTGRRLWQEMMRRMFRSGSVDVLVLLQSLRKLEVNPSYPLQMLTKLPQFEYRQKGKQHVVEMTLLSQPVFNKVEADSYYYEVHLLWLDSRCEQYEGEMQETVWLSPDNDLPVFDFYFKQPAWARTAVVLLKLCGGDGEQPLQTFKAVGMQVVDVLEVGRR